MESFANHSTRHQAFIILNIILVLFTVALIVVDQQDSLLGGLLILLFIGGIQMLWAFIAAIRGNLYMGAYLFSGVVFVIFYFLAISGAIIGPVDIESGRGRTLLAYLPVGMACIHIFLLIVTPSGRTPSEPSLPEDVLDDGRW